MHYARVRSYAGNCVFSNCLYLWRAVTFLTKLCRSLSMGLSLSVCGLEYTICYVNMHMDMIVDLSMNLHMCVHECTSDRWYTVLYVNMLTGMIVSLTINLCVYVRMLVTDKQYYVNMHTYYDHYL